MKYQPFPLSLLCHIQSLPLHVLSQFRGIKTMDGKYIQNAVSNLVTTQDLNNLGMLILKTYEATCIQQNIYSPATQITYTLLALGWTPLCLQNCLNSLHRRHQVLETFLRDFWHDIVVNLLQIGCLHIHEPPIPKHPKGAL